jgi:PhnB protein
VSSARPGFPSVTPRLVATDARGLVEFLRVVFGATGELAADRPAEMRIGDSILLVSAAGIREAFPGFLYVYVDDADAIYRRALAAGAATLEKPLDTPYGDRRAMVRDPWGNIWQIAQWSGPASRDR